MPCNEAATTIFLRCQTQWRVGMAGATGLDYAAVESVIRLSETDDPADCFERVQIMEREALEIWGEQMERQG